MGKNMPRKNMKDPKATRSKGSSLNGRKNSKTSTGFLKGGILDRIVRFAMIIRKRTINAVTLMAHGKPIMGIKR